MLELHEALKRFKEIKTERENLCAQLGSRVEICRIGEKELWFIAAALADGVESLQVDPTNTQLNGGR